MTITKELRLDRVTTTHLKDIYVGVTKALVEDGEIITVVDHNQFVIRPGWDPDALILERTQPLVEKEGFLALTQVDVDEVKGLCSFVHTPLVIAKFNVGQAERNIAVLETVAPSDGQKADLKASRAVLKAAQAALVLVS